MHDEDALTCQAPAKLNLFLHVVGRRSDGYHLLQTLFRFIDCLPSLDGGAEVADHLEAYFAAGDLELPATLRAALHLGTGRWTAPVTGVALRHNVRTLARQFIAAEEVEHLPRVLRRLHRGGVLTTVDLLGERTVSDAEAAARLAGYHSLLQRVVSLPGGDPS